MVNSIVFVELGVVPGEGCVTGIAVSMVTILCMGPLSWGDIGAVLQLGWQCDTRLAVVSGSS